MDLDENENATECPRYTSLLLLLYFPWLPSSLKKKNQNLSPPLTSLDLRPLWAFPWLKKLGDGLLGTKFWTLKKMPSPSHCFFPILPACGTEHAADTPAAGLERSLTGGHLASPVTTCVTTASRPLVSIHPHQLLLLTCCLHLSSCVQYSGSSTFKKTSWMKVSGHPRWAALPTRHYRGPVTGTSLHHPLLLQVSNSPHH